MPLCEQFASQKQSGSIDFSDDESFSSLCKSPLLNIQNNAEINEYYFEM